MSLCFENCVVVLTDVHPSCGDLSNHQKLNSKHVAHSDIPLYNFVLNSGPKSFTDSNVVLDFCISALLLLWSYILF